MNKHSTHYFGTFGDAAPAHRPDPADDSGPPNVVGPRHSAWAPAIATRGGTSLAISGQPLMRGTGVHGRRTTADPAGALLEAYVTQGDDFLQHLAGRFAIAVLDESRNRALLAIDPMGVERVAYAVVAGTLVFGSSAEEVARFDGRPAALQLQAIFDYLMLHMVPAPGTIFRGVAKLRPGHCVVFQNGRASEKRYWTARFTEGEGQSFETLKRELHGALRTAVRDCEPTPTTGAFLSGGLDSSTVAGIASEVGPHPARTFSIGFGYPEYDELQYARIASARFGCEAHEYVVTGDDIAAGFPLIARAYDEPFGNSSALPVYYCARMAREHGVDHLLAGDGGDELFAGNSRYAEQEVFERYRRLPASLRNRLIEPALAAWPRALENWIVRKGRSYVRKASVALPIRMEAWNLLKQLGVGATLHPDFRSAIDESGTFRQMQELWDATPGESTLAHMLYYDWQHTLADNDLRKVETMSTLAGVRVSYPMLHPAVVDLSMRVPPRLMMPGTRLRSFYKRAMQGFLPDEIINKRKHGFGLPFGLWLQESPRLREQIDANLASLRGRAIIRPEMIDRLLHLHGQDDARYYGVFIWVLAMLEQWFQEHRVAL